MILTCAVCDEAKAATEFANNPSAKSGLSNKCRTCFNTQVRNRYTTDDRRRHHLRYRFGLTVEEYATMVAENESMCPICKSPDKPLHIDHDHRCCAGKQSCGKCIRGLLCGPCNRAMGLLGEDIETLQNMIEYLKEHY